MRFKPMKCINRLLFISLTSLLFLASSCTSKTQPAPTEEWTQLSSMPTARSENAAAVIGETIYVSGGFGGEKKFEAYDIATDTWKTLADLPEPRHHLMSASYDGKVYIFGGASSLIDWTPRAEAWVYDPTNDSWTKIADMPEARLAGAAVNLDDYIYVLGGTGGSNALLSYDPARDEWTSLAALSQ